MTDLTNDQQREIAQCASLHRQGLTPQDIRDLGYASGAVEAMLVAQRQADRIVFNER